MSNELVVHSMDDVKTAASAMAKSGYFTDAKEGVQAMVKVMAGHEMGFGPFASMTGIHVIQGKPAIGSNLIAAAIKKHPMYNFRVMEHDDKKCSINFFERWDGKWKSIGNSTFTMEDAKKAGLTSNQTWIKYPKNMLFSRAISNGARWYCPDIFGGAPTYTPEELGVDEDEDGYIVEVKTTAPEVIEATFEQNEPEPANIEYPAWLNSIETSKGEAYVMVSTEKLSFMLTALNKQEFSDERDMKIKAIKTIFELRNAVEQPAMI